MPPTPLTCTVYAPGGRAASRAASREPAGRAKAPTRANAAASAVPPPQLSLASIRRSPANSCSSGSATTPGTPKGAAPRVGPTARTSTVRGEEPPTTKPATSPVPRCLSTETFTSRGVAALNGPLGVASYSSAITVPAPVPAIRAEWAPAARAGRKSAASREPGDA